MTVDFAVHSRCLAGLGGQGPYPGNISDSFPVRKPAMSAFESTSNGSLADSQGCRHDVDAPHPASRAETIVRAILVLVPLKSHSLLGNS